MNQEIFPIYLDYAATTPIDPVVADTMIAYIKTEKNYGNSSSTTHVFGLTAKKAIEDARYKVANLIKAKPEEIIWTSSTTEAINLALKGAANFYKNRGNHIITSATEHKAGLSVCRKLEDQGFVVTYLPVDKEGFIRCEDLKAAIRPDTIMISIMHVNNETGVIQRVEKLSEIAKQHAILFHMDAAQSIGKLPIDVNNLNVDFISLSSHKIYGPKGIGALYIRSTPPVYVQAEMDGGGQENGLRSGTLATHQIVGMGQAFALASQRMNEDQQHCLMLKQFLLKELANISDIVIHTPNANSIPNIISFSIPHVKNIILLNQLKEMAISSGSACTSTAFMSGSHVLHAMGLGDDMINTAIRLSWGRLTTISDIKISCAALKHAINQLRPAL